MITTSTVGSRYNVILRQQEKIRYRPNSIIDRIQHFGSDNSFERLFFAFLHFYCLLSLEKVSDALLLSFLAG